MAGTSRQGEGTYQRSRRSVDRRSGAQARRAKLDQLAGDVKDGIEKAIDTVKDAVTGKKRVPR